jgi:hypothetical protein
METLQVIIKSEDEEKAHTEETPCLELVKSER